MIKAIETSYKGYRFRSRLEARWAVFFDALGLDWDYEPEGFDLGDAGWYLPDFRLNDLGVWVEVKPTLDIKPVNVYLAGKIEKNCWRNSIANLRGAENNFSSAFEWEEVSSFLVPGVSITGPFFMGCDHGCSHGDGTHGQALSGCAEAEHGELGGWDWRKNVIKNCKNAIKKSDVFFVWINDLTCYGTLVEAGLAYAEGKKIYMGVDFKQSHRIDDVWFLRGMSEKFGVFESAKEAFESFFEKNQSMKEFEKVSSVSRATRLQPLIVGGDPMSCNAWGSGVAIRKLFDSHGFNAAAQKARSARFEHGETP